MFRGVEVFDRGPAICLIFVSDCARAFPTDLGVAFFAMGCFFLDMSGFPLWLVLKMCDTLRDYLKISGQCVTARIGKSQGEAPTRCFDCRSRPTMTLRMVNLAA